MKAKKLLAPLLVIAIAAPLEFLSAESIVWTHTEPETTLCTTRGDGYRYCDYHLSAPSYSISYHVRATHLDAQGAVLGPLTCGDTIRRGEKVKFEFLPHNYQDASWFATGGYMDSPYGDWIDKATGPTPVACNSKDFLVNTGGIGIYAPFVVNPPTKRVVPLLGFSCTGADASIICTGTDVGGYGGVFNIGSTYAHFYQRLNAYGDRIIADPTYCARHDDSHNEPMVALTASQKAVLAKSRRAAEFTDAIKGRGEYDDLANQVYRLAIPAQQLTCPVMVVDTDSKPPAVPIASQITSSCVAGSTMWLSVTATDPDGDRIRYLVDWNNDGSVDEINPASGHVSSGQTHRIARTFATGGSKQLRVAAEDVHGVRSQWALVTFTCSAPPPTSHPRFLEGDAVTGGDSSDADTSFDHAGQWSGLNGSVDDLNLRAIPSLVRPGVRARIHWSSINMASCSVAAPNGDAWSGLDSRAGGEITLPITDTTVFTLDCLDRRGEHHLKKATIKVIPTWQER